MRCVRADAPVALATEIKSDQVWIQQLQDRLKVTMVDEILFPEGGWQLSHKEDVEDWTGLAWSFPTAGYWAN